ncbi:MAG: hypothetical protein AAF449_23060, partial [Myxococcota bacterium]
MKANFGQNAPWLHTQPSLDVNNLDQVSTIFEMAAATRSGAIQDMLIDQLSQRVRDTAPWTGLKALEQNLDHLGAMARGFGDLYHKDNDTLQRLRSLLLAALDDADGLHAGIGLTDPQQLLFDAMDLSRRMKEGAHQQPAAMLDGAIQRLMQMLLGQMAGAGPWAPPGRSSFGEPWMPQ